MSGVRPSQAVRRGRGITRPARQRSGRKVGETPADARRETEGLALTAKGPQAPKKDKKKKRPKAAQQRRRSRLYARGMEAGGPRPSIAGAWFTTARSGAAGRARKKEHGAVRISMTSHIDSRETADFSWSTLRGWPLTFNTTNLHGQVVRILACRDKVAIAASGDQNTLGTDRYDDVRVSE